MVSLFRNCTSYVSCPFVLVFRETMHDKFMASGNSMPRPKLQKKVFANAPSEGVCPALLCVSAQPAFGSILARYFSKLRTPVPSVPANTTSQDVRAFCHVSAKFGWACRKKP